MKNQLPNAISTFFSVGNGTAETAPSEYFAEDAIVHDEDQSYQGPAAIQAWRAESRRKYLYHAEPIAVTQEATGVKVRANVTGNFPGSPAQIEYIFQLAGDKIKTLEIH